MATRAETRWLLWAGGAWFVLATPQSRAWLESSMALHMLVQLPLLALIGYCVGRAWLRAQTGSASAQVLGRVQSFNAGGATGLIAASFVMLLWMLPRCLDLARFDAVADVVKFISVPAAGLAIALSWPKLPVIARAVVHLEVIATLFRFGWGYLATDQRLCLAYLADDQQHTGELLIWLGLIYAVAVVWRPMFGTIPRTRSA